MNYKVVIPTHRRADIIEDYALYWLRKWNIEESKIYLFCADKEDYIEYKNKFGNTNINIIETNTDGLAENRNFITDYFEEDEYILCMDDSFCGLKILVDNGPKLEILENIHSLIEFGFNEMERVGTKIWGVNSIENGLWMRNKIDYNNGCIIGKFWGYKVDKDDELKISSKAAEDVERCIRHYKKFGCLVRLMWICFDRPEYGKVKGGLQSKFKNLEERIKRNNLDIEEIKAKFPDFCELKYKDNTKDKNPFTTVKFLSPDIKIIKDIEEKKKNIKIKDLFMKVETVKIDLIKLNKDNPRVIKKDKMNKLVKSILDFPEMLQVRPIVVDEDMVVLGGNMRLQACKKAGLLELPIIRFENLTEEQKREFVVKDNVGYGEWDWEIINDEETEWDINALEEWGLDVKRLNTDEEEEGEIGFNESLDFESNYIVLKFSKDIDWLQAQSIFGIETGWNKGGNGKGYTKGRGRVVDGVNAILKIKESNEG